MNRNIILKTFDEVRYFRKRLIFAIELKEKVTFLILSNEPIFDIETLRNYLIENELNQFAKNEIINLIELIDSFLKLKIKYEAVPKSENHFSYEYPNKGKGVGGGNLMYVLKVNDNFLKVNEATFSEKEPLYSRLTSLNCFNISNRLLEIKDLFVTYLEQPQQPEPEAIDLSDTTATEKIIYLQKLGVIDFLRTKQPFNTSINSLGTVLSAITGVNPETKHIQSMLNPIISKEAGQKNNPLNSTKTVSKVEKQLRDIGFNLNETI